MLFFALLAVRGYAVLFVATGDPSYNTNAPTGSLTNSGWQYEGHWNSWLGTPIAPTFFLTAHHINGAPGNSIVLNGFSYTTTAFFDDPSTDLRIWQVAQTFPYYAPLFTKSNEVGSACVVIGRGTERGPMITTTTTSMGHTTITTNGWLWGNTNNIERWGQNTVSGITTDTFLHPGAQLLSAAFQSNGMTNECDQSYNDSGGAMFIQDGTTWKLAGINYAVSDPFVSTNGVNGSTMSVAVLDYFHLYVLSGTNWVQITQHESGGFACTRVSARISWINSIINYNLGNDLGITGLQTVGGDALINLITGSNRFYRVDYTTNLVSAIWTTLTNNIPGTGGVVTVTDPGAASKTNRFYRAAIMP